MKQDVFDDHHFESLPVVGAELRGSIRKMTDAIAEILAENAPSVYLYGSVALGDFRLGWSDIDILVLTEKQISQEQAEWLVCLRQEMTEREPDDPYYRLFEGGMLSLDAFLSGSPDTVVYWGTSGQRITDRYAFDSFCQTELPDNGVLLYGKDVRERLRRPVYADLRADVEHHYQTVRAHGGETGRSLYSFGWLLDISRCIYTLRTGRIIAKTKAGAWALANGLCPDAAALAAALRVRSDPALFQSDEQLWRCAETLGDAVQRYADVLERELYRLPHFMFGERDRHTDYWDRSGAYLLAVQNGKMAVVQTKRGYFLPGGGLEDGESDADCIRREVLEETGRAAEVGVFLCSAEHYTVHDTKGPFHPIQSYYVGTISKQLAPPQESDIQFLWLPLEEVRGNFYSVMQNRALEALIDKQSKTR